MGIEWAGPAFAATTVATIWLGHELVRKVNYHFGTWPAIPLFALGIAITVSTLFVTSPLLSGVLGIIGLTTIVDGNEILRQEKRIRRGHAPENPNRPVKRYSGNSHI